MPLFRQFRATSVHRAFVLNSLAVSLTVMTALLVEKALLRLEHGEEALPKLSAQYVLVVLAATFAASLLSFYSLWIIFDFGGGMLVLNKVPMH